MANTWSDETPEQRENRLVVLFRVHRLMEWQFGCCLPAAFLGLGSQFCVALWPFWPCLDIDDH
jgi:hypothetical protein